jgi:hypothetical protein
MHSTIGALQPSNPKRSSIKAHIINAQINGFASAQPMPVHHQEEEMIPGTLPTSFRSF